MPKFLGEIVELKLKNKRWGKDLSLGGIKG